MKLIIVYGVFFIQEIVATNLCNDGKCVQKCCPASSYLFQGNCTSHAGKGDFNLKVYNQSIGKDRNFQEIGNIDDFFIVKPGSWQVIEKNKRPYTVLYNSYYLVENGSMIMDLKSEPGYEVFGPDEYCIDLRIVNDELNKTVIVRFTNKNSDTGENGNHVTLKWGFLVSSVFLLLVLVVYSLVPELRNMGGLILMAYVASLLMGYLFLFTVQIGAPNFDEKTCLAITSLTYYFLLASFCWLNVMSYDIWWTFRGYAKARPINRFGENVKFRIYCLYAFGTPLAMTIALATLNEMNLKHELAGIVPEIPMKGCFIEGKAKFAYLYAPMLIMIITNWMFFLMTAFNIWRLSRGSEVLRTADSAASGSASARKRNKQRFLMYLKLSVIMGLSWILEVVSALKPKFAGWYITDFYNVFMGVIIFAIFVCKKKILNKLKKRYNNFRHKHKLSLQSKSQSRTRSSQDESNTQSIPLCNVEPSK